MEQTADDTCEAGEVGPQVAAADEGADQVEKIPFAFTKCSSVERKGMSSYLVECLNCGKKAQHQP